VWGYYIFIKLKGIKSMPKKLSKKEKIIEVYNRVEMIPKRPSYTQIAKEAKCSRSYVEQVLNIVRAETRALEKIRQS